MLVPRLLSLLFFALCFPISVSAQMIPPGPGDTGFGGVNSITGMVLLGGTRIERHVAVRLQTQTKGDRVVMTDDYGNFAFRGLLSGDYTIVIDKEPEFKPFAQVVSIVQPRGFPAQNYTLSIRLEFKERSDSKPAVLNAELANVPKPALVHYFAAADKAKKDDHPGAIEELKLAIQEYPSFTQALNELGVQYVKMNQLEDADEAFQEALRSLPMHFPSY